MVPADHLSGGPSGKRGGPEARTIGSVLLKQVAADGVALPNGGPVVLDEQRHLALRIQPCVLFRAQASKVHRRDNVDCALEALLAQQEAHSCAVVGDWKVIQRGEAGHGGAQQVVGHIIYCYIA